MKLNVCLFGSMRKYADKDTFQMELNEGSTLYHLLDYLRIEDRIYLVILIDGRRAYEDEPLTDGAEVLIMTPSGGG